MCALTLLYLGVPINLVSNEHIFLHPLSGETQLKAFTIGSDGANSLAQVSVGTDMNSQNTADFTKDIWSPKNKFDENTHNKNHKESNSIHEIDMIE